MFDFASALTVAVANPLRVTPADARLQGATLAPLDTVNFVNFVNFGGFPRA
jgi:hypothetical protein